VEILKTKAKNQRTRAAITMVSLGTILIVSGCTAADSTTDLDAQVNWGIVAFVGVLLNLGSIPSPLCRTTPRKKQTRLRCHLPLVLFLNDPWLAACKKTFNLH